MPAEQESRTEPPTARRRAEAREKGQIARSPDLTAAVLLLGGLLALRMWGSDIFGHLLAGTRFFLGGSGDVTMRAADLSALPPAAATLVMRVVLPFFLLLFVLSLIVTWFQVGWMLNFGSLKPSLERLNLVKGLTRLFTFRKVVELLMNLGKMAAVLVVVVVTIQEKMPEVLAAMRLDHAVVVAHGAELCYVLGIRMAIVLLVLAIVDYFYRKYKHEQDLKMTKEEVKDEMRRMEGDPQIKRRRREMQFQASLQRIRSAVPRADVVVTNPTEFAVAIEYNAERMGAPTVVAKGQDYLAQQIRRVAIEARVPIVQRPALARALYRSVEVGQEIPERFYKGVAEILAYVYELAGRSGSRRPASAAG